MGMEFLLKAVGQYLGVKPEDVLATLAHFRLIAEKAVGDFGRQCDTIARVERLQLITIAKIDRLNGASPGDLGDAALIEQFVERRQ